MSQVTFKVTAQDPWLRTDRLMNIDLSVPIWTIDHVAAALHLKVDTAREHTYRGDFPAAKDPFAQNLWLREEVLAWFANLPPADRRLKRTRPTSTGTVASRAPKPRQLTREQETIAAQLLTGTDPRTTTADLYNLPSSTAKSYKPRSR